MENQKETIIMSYISRFWEQIGVRMTCLCRFRRFESSGGSSSGGLGGPNSKDDIMGSMLGVPICSETA